jgi:hypothetical protein
MRDDLVSAAPEPQQKTCVLDCAWPRDVGTEAGWRNNSDDGLGGRRRAWLSVDEKAV